MFLYIACHSVTDSLLSSRSLTIKQTTTVHCSAPVQAISVCPKHPPTRRAGELSYDGALDERGGLLQLFHTNSSLHISDLQVVTEVAVHILVVVTLRKLTVLTIKAMAEKLSCPDGQMQLRLQSL